MGNGQTFKVRQRQEAGGKTHGRTPLLFTKALPPTPPPQFILCSMLCSLLEGRGGRGQGEGQGPPAANHQPQPQPPTANRPKKNRRTPHIMRNPIPTHPPGDFFLGHFLVSYWSFLGKIPGRSPMRTKPHSPPRSAPCGTARHPKTKPARRRALETGGGGGGGGGG
jgi:hypothetical protein